MPELENTWRAARASSYKLSTSFSLCETAAFLSFFQPRQQRSSSHHRGFASAAEQSPPLLVVRVINMAEKRKAEDELAPAGADAKPKLTEASSSSAQAAVAPAVVGAAVAGGAGAGAGAGAPRDAPAAPGEVRRPICSASRWSATSSPASKDSGGRIIKI